MGKCVALLLTMLVTLGTATSQETQDQADFETIHLELVESNDLQFNRPEDAEAPPPEDEAGSNYRSPLGGALNALGPLAQVLFWSLIVFLVATLLIFMGRSALSARRDAAENEKRVKQTSTAPSGRPTATLARARLEEADKLAEQGQFAEAVHKLLFRSIEDLEAERKVGFAQSLTAREIGAMDGVSDTAQDALKPINALVEKGIFGAKPLSEDDYAKAREAYSRFAFGARD